MKALYLQLEFELQRFRVKPNTIETLFIGGGTPSTISPKLYRPIFELLDRYLTKDVEITTEANPNSATKKWLSGMRDLGVNRVSFGVQSFDTHKLKALNRSHTATEAIDAINNAYAIGFRHISLDIIFNYRGDTTSLLQSDIEKAFNLPINHISLYELTIESGTDFAKRAEVRQESDELALFVADSIIKRGFTHYEISNFGKYQSRHNRGYWEGREYIGAGAGAVGFRGSSRFYPSTDIDSYIKEPLRIKEESLSDDELLTEMIFLGLRSDVGIGADRLPTHIRENCNFLVKESKLLLKDGRYYNTNLFLADEIALFLLG
jgi:oxygen-independent coproporphyrinogen-3 oxidase